MASSYYNVQVARVDALEDDKWWAPGLSYPCGLPGHLHSLAVCGEFWGMEPGDRHIKLHSGSVCKNCLGPQTLCSPLGLPCTKEIPEGLLCTGCREKSKEWGYPTFNALFCTRTDPTHAKPEPKVLMDAAKEYLGNWALTVTLDKINVGRHNVSAYRAELTNEEGELFQVSPTVSGSVPAFDTRTGEEVSVPTTSIVPGPIDHPTYILQWIKLGSSELLVFFYRGASCNLIQGEIAEKEGLPVFSSSPGKLRVRGGLEIDTVHRVYKVCLGPNGPVTTWRSPAVACLCARSGSRSTHWKS